MFVVADVPQALVRRDQAFYVAAAVGVRLDRPPRQHQFEDAQHLPGDLDIVDVARMVERDQQLVLEPARVSSSGRAGARQCRAGLALGVVRILAAHIIYDS